MTDLQIVFWMWVVERTIGLIDKKRLNSSGLLGVGLIGLAFIVYTGYLAYFKG